MILSLATVGGISFVLALSGALTPGPLLTITISESMRRGFITGPLLILGHGILEFTLIVAIVNGLGTFLKKGPVMGTVAIIGGLVLLWMGWKMVKETKEVNLSLKERPVEGYKTLHPIWSGILVSLSNPYWSLWWATIGLGYMMTAMEYGLMGLVVFFIGHILADFLWFSLVSYGVSSGRRVINHKVYQKITIGCGIFLLLFGVWFLMIGFRYLFFGI